MTIVILRKELVQKSYVSELRRSRNEVSRHSTQDCRNAETRFKGNVNKVHPMVQINWNMIGRLLFSLTVNSSITNLLAKQTHYCESVARTVSSVTNLLAKQTDDYRLVGVSVGEIVVSLLPKEMGS
jgi:hypothetical protein